MVASRKRRGMSRLKPSDSIRCGGSPCADVRHECFVCRGARVFPSYLQAGPSFFIEKSKRRMIAEDIAAALALSR